MGTLRGKRIYRDASPLVVDAKELPGLLDEYGPACAMWKDYKTFGLPYAGGYMQHPAVWVNTMRILEAESAIWIEEHGNSGRAKDSSKSRSQ